MSKKIEIIPAILPRDFTEVEEKVGLVKDFVKIVQIDVCDGQLTPVPTWPYKKEDDSFERILREEEGMPFWENVNYEIDLMVNNPVDHIDEWVTAGATRIVIHAASKGDVLKAIDALKGRAEVGVAFDIGNDTAHDALSFLKEAEHGGFDNIGFVQFMGIDRVGFQGQEFNEKVIEKIKEFRDVYTEMPISVDGAVSFENAKQLIEAGATRLVIGSAIFGAGNYQEALRKFKLIAHGRDVPDVTAEESAE